MESNRLTCFHMLCTLLWTFSGREVLGYGEEEEVWVVLEEDGTEVRSGTKALLNM